MIETNNRIRFSCRLKDIYYAESIQAEHPGYDVVYYLYCQEKRKPYKEFFSLHIDVTQKEEELLKSFNYQTRKSIRKMFNREDHEVRIIDRPTAEDVVNYTAYFNKFAAIKNISSCPRKLLDELKNSGKLVMIQAVISQEILSQFVCILQETRAIMYNGCTSRLFEPADKQKLQLIIDAHRMADYQAMLYFKRQGFKIFDFCGLVTDNETRSSAAVNRYKLGFGGSKVTQYHFIQPFTVKGRIFCFFKNMMGGI